MASPNSIVWTIPELSVPPRMPLARLRALGKSMLDIPSEFGTGGKTPAFFEPPLRQILHAAYHATDEKFIDAQVICRHIVPGLARRQTYLSIGAGEGQLSANVLGMGQFAQAVLVECARDVVPVLSKFFGRHFKNRHPTLLHHVLQVIALSQGYDFLGKPRLKYTVLQGEFPAEFYSQYVGPFEPVKSRLGIAPGDTLVLPPENSHSHVRWQHGSGGPTYLIRYERRGPPLRSGYQVYQLHPGLPQADLVCMDHMINSLIYDPLEHVHWVEAARQAYALVKPGGALLVLVRGDALFHAPNEMAPIIQVLGGQNDDIDGFALELEGALPEARFEFLAAKTRHWAACMDYDARHSSIPAEESMLHLVKFFALDANLPAGDAALRASINRHLLLPDEGIYEAIHADKFIVAHKPLPEKPLHYPRISPFASFESSFNPLGPAPL